MWPLMPAMHTRVPAGTINSPTASARLNNTCPWAWVAPLRCTSTAHASKSSHLPRAVFTKKLGSTVSAVKSISHSTGRVTNALTMRQNGE
ncbi:hypothetical protein D3C78_1495440 [compost metagenome]